MNTKKALCLLMPVLVLAALKSFGRHSSENVQYYTNTAYLQNEINEMTGTVCPLVFDIVFFDDGENRPGGPIEPVIPECPLRSTIFGGQSVGVPIPTGENGMPVPVWLEVFNPATGVMLLMKVTVTPEGCGGIIHIEQVFSSNPWDYSANIENHSASFTPLVSEDPSTALTLGFDNYISAGQMISNIAAGYTLKVYYCIPGGVSPGGGRKVEANSPSQAMRQSSPTNASTLFSESLNAKRNNNEETFSFKAIINNPVRDILQIRLKQPDNIQALEASLWSVQGVPVSERYVVAPGEDQLDILTSYLSPGFYVLRLKNETIISSHVFIKL